MELKDKEYIEYKGLPLVKDGDVIYYGYANAKYILRLDIIMKDPQGNPSMIFITICPTNDMTKVIKQSTKTGLYDALDLGAEWLQQLYKEDN